MSEKLKAVVRISGAKDQTLYGRNLERLKQRTIKALTRFEPGVLSLYPKDIVFYTEVIDPSRWKETGRIEYAALRSEDMAWRKARK